MSKLDLNFSKIDGRDSANKKFYQKTFDFFSEQLEIPERKEITQYAIFMFAEIVDNFYNHDFQNFTYVSVEIDLNVDTADVTVVLKDDGSGFDPFNESSNCSNIRNASMKINCPPPNLGELRGSTDTINRRKFNFNLNKRATNG